jgi:hypothetical protein
MCGKNRNFKFGNVRFLIIYGDVMKFFQIVLLLVLTTGSLYSQDNTWLTDVTEDLGLSGQAGSRVFCVDVNGDDFPDLLFTGASSIRNTLELFLNIEDTENPGNRKYIRYTEESGINAPVYEGRETRWSDVAGFADFDNDGDMDLMTCTYTHRITYFIKDGEIEKGHYSEVLLNDGTGKFTILENSGMHDIKAHSGKVTVPIKNPETDSTELKAIDYPAYFLNATGISFLDYDLDGNIDAYISTWFTNYLTDASNYMYAVKMNDILMKGNGDGTFTQVIDNAVNSVKQPMYGVNVTDYNNDGLQDVVTSAYCRSGGSIFKNNGDGTFFDATDETGYTSQLIGGDHGQNLCQWEAIPGDFDNDGDIDLLQIEVHGGFDEGEGRTHVSINQGPNKMYRYEWNLDMLERKIPTSRTHGGDMGGTWYDIDGDMKLDAIICQSGYESGSTNVEGQTRTYFIRQNEDGEFKEITEELGLIEAANRPHSAEPCDYDLNGANDLFLSRTYALNSGEAQKCYQTVWRNNRAAESFWTSVKAIAPEGSNKAAIGTRITVYSDGISQIREIQSGMGHFGNTQPLIKNFGLADIPGIDSMKVRFQDPAMSEIKVHHPPVNAILKVGINGLEGFVTPYSENPSIIGFNTAKVDFDLVNFGESKDEFFYLKNYGTADLIITSASIINNESGSYEIFDGPGYPLVIAPGDSVIYGVRFTPTERTTFNSLIEFESDAYNSNGGYLRLTGQCFKEEPMISSLQTDLDFGTVLNEESKELEIEIRNFGELDLEISSVSFEPQYFEHFTVLDETIERTVKSGETTTYTLSFAPNVEEDADIETILEIYSNAYNANPLVINIIGRAETRKAFMAFDSEDKSIDFGESELGCECEEPLLIYSTGTKALEINEIAFRFDKEENFGVKDYAAPYIIEPGESTEIIFTFNPTREGLVSKQMTIKSNDYDDDLITFSIKGTGTDKSNVNDSYDELSFTLYPNPVKDNAILSYKLENTAHGDITVEIYDYLANKVKEFKLNGTAGSRSETLEMGDLAPGAYILRINESGRHTEKTIIISR